MRRLAESFEDLNSSLAQPSVEIFACKLLGFSLNLPERKVLIIAFQEKISPHHYLITPTSKLY